MLKVELYPLGIIRKSLYKAKLDGNINSDTLNYCLTFLDSYSDLYKGLYKLLRVELSDSLEWSE